MHPRNRFWSVMAKVVGSSVPEDVEGKKQWLLDNNIALMDIIYSCNRKGSLDSDITDVVPNDIEQVLNTANIRGIFCNGRKSFETAKKTYPNLTFYYLPSTSPANAGKWNEEEWLKIKECLK